MYLGKYASANSLVGYGFTKVADSYQLKMDDNNGFFIYGKEIIIVLTNPKHKEWLLSHQNRLIELEIFTTNKSIANNKGISLKPIKTKGKR